MVPWSSGNTGASCGSCDSDISADQAHLPEQNILVGFGGGWGRRGNDKKTDA